MTVIFNENFENNNLNAWSGGGASGATIATSSTVANMGTYSAKITGLTAANSYAYKEYSFSSKTTVYAREYVYFTADFANSQFVWCLIGLLGTVNAYISLYRNPDGSYKWAIGTGGATTVYGYSSDFTLALNTWYCIELYVYAAVSGTVIGYVNGESFSTYNGNTGTEITSCRVEAYQVDNANAGTIYFDDYIISDVYNGPLVSGIQKFCLLNMMGY
jgi:hypothetical protein